MVKREKTGSPKSVLHSNTYVKDIYIKEESSRRPEEGQEEGTSVEYGKMIVILICTHLIKLLHISYSQYNSTLPFTMSLPCFLDPTIFFGCISLWTLGYIHGCLVCTKGGSKFVFGYKSSLNLIHQHFD